MPYHPPQTDAFTNELRWFLVAVPDKPEYVRAGFGAYSEFTKYWLWDNQVGDANAAADSWDEAVNATLEALEMGFPDVLLGHIDEVESLLREIRDTGGGLNCCTEVPGADTIVSDVPSNLETSDTDVGGGVFPGGMTAGEFDTYLCNAATAYVNKIIEVPDEALEQFQIGFALMVTLIVIFTTGAYIGIAGAIAGVVTVTTILNFIGVLEEIIEGITNGTEDNPSVPSQELTDAKDALVCAIYEANDADAAATALRTEIQNAVSSTGWENLLLLWPHETLLAKVFNGDAPDAPTAVCNCETVPEGYTFVEEDVAPRNHVKAPPACDTWFDTFYSCWSRDAGSYAGDVRVLGTVNLEIDSFTANANCAGDADLKVIVRICRGANCSPSCGTPFTTLYDEGAEPDGPKSLSLPFDITQASLGAGTHVRLEVRVDTRAGNISNLRVDPLTISEILEP